MSTATMPPPERRGPLEPIYREMVWRIPIGVAVLEMKDTSDPGSARIVGANPAALQMKGLGWEQVQGKTLRDVLPGVLSQLNPESIAEFLRGNAPRDLGEVPGVLHPERTYAVKVFPLPGEYVGVVFENVTHHKALLEAEDRFWKAVQAAPFAMGVIRLRDAEVREANRRFQELFGFPDRQELMGHDAFDLGMWDDRSAFERVVADLRQRGEIREAPLVGRRQDGRTFRALVALELIRFEGEECVLALFWRG